MDLITILTIILSVVSSTLSVVAIIFAWVSYKNSSKMQMDAQAILEKITQKIEVVAQSTANQIDKAWNYFTNTNYSLKDDTSKTLLDIESIKQKFINETKEEINTLINDLGTDKNKINELSQKVEFLVQKTTDVTEELILKQTLINNLQSLNGELIDWSKRTKKMIFPDNIELREMINVLEHERLLPDILLMRFNYLLSIRNKIIHGDTVNSIELQNSLLTVDEIRKIFKDE
ncbi:MAG: hypothetical protein ACYCVH_11105 [Ignavibacteriaceae bacterium]